MAVDPSSMVMAGVAERGPGHFHTQVALGVGTSQEREALILLSYVRKLQHPNRLCRVIPDSESSMGALQTYIDGGYCGDGIHHLQAHILQGAQLAPTAAIKIVTMPSHWITEPGVDVATKDEPAVNLMWMLRCPFCFVPMEKFRDHSQPALLDLQDWLQAQATIPVHVWCEHPWADWYKPGIGPPGLV